MYCTYIAASRIICKRDSWTYTCENLEKKIAKNSDFFRLQAICFMVVRAKAELCYRGAKTIRSQGHLNLIEKVIDLMENSYYFLCLCTFKLP